MPARRFDSRVRLARKKVLFNSSHDHEFISSIANLMLRASYPAKEACARKILEADKADFEAHSRYKVEVALIRPPFL